MTQAEVWQVQLGQPRASCPEPDYLTAGWPMQNSQAAHSPPCSWLSSLKQGFSLFLGALGQIDDKWQIRATYNSTSKSMMAGSMSGCVR
mmetsp:Transcript_34247/g.86623  ORF Transcript_34247/g.86623 Transcript_34247/m.86623 type:complete len:89 (-) Transcript_34247:32-298(-)